MPKAAVCPAVGEALEVVEVGARRPKAGEVRIRMGASGVCHSDLSVVNGTLLSPLPAVLGHEGAGVVDPVGEGVDPREARRPRRPVVRPAVRQVLHVHARPPEMCETGFIAMALGAQLDMTPRFTRRRRPAAPDGRARHVRRGAVIPAIGAVKIDTDIPITRAALIGCGVLTGFGAAVNTASIRQGRHRRRHRLRRCGPRRDPGREVTPARSGSSRSTGSTGSSTPRRSSARPTSTTRSTTAIRWPR